MVKQCFLDTFPSSLVFFMKSNELLEKKKKTVDNCDHISPQENKDVKSVLSVKALS